MLIAETLQPLAVADGEPTAIELIVVVGALLMLVVHEVFALARTRMDRPDHAAGEDPADAPGERDRGPGAGA